MQDIEISHRANLIPILDVSKQLEIPEEYIESYGKYKAKISSLFYEKIKENKDGKLILVTAMSPTPLGEGKTTVSIGLADALSKNARTILTLREPSMGPVFGLKGGATGGGYSQVAPMEEINLHFTGDIHAVTAANNLLSAIIDNHIYFGNKLRFKKVLWHRCLDLNDRQLREVTTGVSKEKKLVSRQDYFDISVATETMAILCMASNLVDLKKRLGNILIGYDEYENPIYAKDIKANGAMAVLLKQAFSPNLVQTLENTPTIIHGGPFANIAHGCNSIMATKMALKLADYTVTEAGFGADLGAEKFLDIKTRLLPKSPDAVVCVATIKALKYHGGMKIEEIQQESLDYLEKGFKNLIKHINNIKEVFGLPVIVALNKYSSDTNKEIEYLDNKLKKQNIQLSIVESWKNGGKGAIDLAKKVEDICQIKNQFKYVYELSDTIESKIRKVATKIYGAKQVEFTSEALGQIDKIKKLGYETLPICIAKTPYSFSDNPKNNKEEFSIHINEIELKLGAGFIVVKTGKILTMPGLPEVPAAQSIDIDENGNIIGIF